MMKTEERIDIFMDIMDRHVDGTFISYLVDNGFFTAPASTKFHGAYEGGLFDHSFAVANQLEHLTGWLGLQWRKQERSPLVVGMFHDICKIDNYIKVGERFVYNKDAEKGHGDKSVKILKQFIDLTEEEELCIRWHMGAFDEKENWPHYSGSVKRYPNVLWTHTADMIASQVRGI